MVSGNATKLEIHSLLVILTALFFVAIEMKKLSTQIFFVDRTDSRNKSFKAYIKT